jgi:hypothetical protein
MVFDLEKLLIITTGYYPTKSSVADPDPPEPYVVKLPGSGSGSINQRYESGSFYQQAEIVRKS